MKTCQCGKCEIKFYPPRLYDYEIYTWNCEKQQWELDVAKTLESILLQEKEREANAMKISQSHFTNETTDIVKVNGGMLIRTEVKTNYDYHTINWSTCPPVGRHNLFCYSIAKGWEQQIDGELTALANPPNFEVEFQRIKVNK